MSISGVSRLLRRIIRHVGLVALDAAVTVGTLIAALALRMNGAVPVNMWAALEEALPVVAVVSAAVFYAVGLYRNVWRFTSISDIWRIVAAVSLAIMLSFTILMQMHRGVALPSSVPIIQWFMLIVCLGCVRIVRRALPDQVKAVMNVIDNRPASSGRRTLIAGSPEQVEIVLRRLELEPAPRFQPVGILDNTDVGVMRRIRGIPILGAFDALDHVVEKLSAHGQRPEALILAMEGQLVSGSEMVRLISLAESLGLSVARANSSTTVETSASHELQLRPIDLSALLGRPQASLDANGVATLIAGKTVLVTGAGGTIGMELVRQIATFAPAKLVLLDLGEFNLYSIDLELQENFPEIPRTPTLCNICQRESVMKVFADHKPDLVFHAAALKHVPLVEQNPCAGVQTNVLGTRNVADAARRFGAAAMIQVSTDKAVNPVGMMGATKRLGELYCQALDLAGDEVPGATRYITVRFGNVLGSSGSLIPLFRRQLSRRAALTVTHPEIKRYFMTGHEAVQLILKSTHRALEGAARRGRIFVLDMGEPIRILDIAKRMIRLAGLEPEVDVKIEIVGLRPGEKLYEELFDEREERLPSAIPGVFEAEPSPVPLDVLTAAFRRLGAASARNDVAAVRGEIARILRPEPAEQEASPARPAAAKHAKGPAQFATSAANTA